MMSVNKAASAEIFALAERYGLVDAYANAPGSRIGEYIGTVNGSPLSCVVYDRDPTSDLRALRLALGIPADLPGQLPLFTGLRKEISKNGQVLSEVTQ